MRAARAPAGRGARSDPAEPDFERLLTEVVFEYHRSPDPRERGLRRRRRTCLHIDTYYRHRGFGFLGPRLQTWCPFTIQIWLNGREWLAPQLQRQGRPDVRRPDTCVPWLGNPALTQHRMDRQLVPAGPRALDARARALHPLHREIFTPWPHTSSWSAYQTEWATDILFTNPQALAAISPARVRHATLHFQRPDVMRFLGRTAHGTFTGELTTSFKAHGVIQKIPKTHRYKLTPKGHLLTAALFAVREATLSQLIGHAA